LLLWAGVPKSWRAWFDAVQPDALNSANERRVTLVLKWTTVLLLAGHGALGAITRKPVFETHYASIGLPGGLTPMIGWFEIVLAAVVAARPVTPLLVCVLVWKLSTESLWVTSGAPIWEFVE